MKFELTASMMCADFGNLEREVRSLEEGGVPRKERKAHLDRIAAVLILQGYLDSLAFQAEQG